MVLVHIHTIKINKKTKYITGSTGAAARLSRCCDWIVRVDCD